MARLQINQPAPQPVAETFLACLARAKHETTPFDYWLLKDAIPEEDVDAIVDLAASPPEDMVLNGKRETNNALRFFFSPENQEMFPVCRRVAEGFKDIRVRRAIEQTTGTDLSNAHPRIEYCQDPPGFWLEPHTDILVKKFTMLVYLLDDPTLRLVGTDIHQGPPDFEYVTTAPYGRNLGVIFIPSKNSWHGVGHHPIQGLRKSIIINYVSSDWRDTFELA
ncbi:MAG: 2OG-Fe(II) oxygenase [Actinomycetota bacterium]